MMLIADVVFAEDLHTGITLHRKEIQPFAGIFRTVFSQVRKFHFQTCTRSVISALVPPKVLPAPPSPRVLLHPHPDAL